MKDINRNELKERLINQISLFGDGKDYFETRDINELLNWIDELMASRKAAKLPSDYEINLEAFRLKPNSRNLEDNIARNNWIWGAKWMKGIAGNDSADIS